ncbi:uncharacterized protein F5891DRAFT_107025 [Suillus fuscotomentosus]|uniref:Uncharacterized protein n=1 Tax=Suillus fuscotomentosus TaxID=1912939 RepID=A0AAD4DR21_9AGAM|nr:uncharacterized protein F5891DRAFT_107025 [Suillus fuscotomentosus]KAG1890695.1 hypothetical protein F5891DRAFT_107025 [Suillus fuscotomentosus]
MADSSPHAITSLEALAVILLADAETPDDQLFAATISLQALDAKQRGAKYGPRGPYDQQKAEQFFEHLLHISSARIFKTWFRSLWRSMNVHTRKNGSKKKEFQGIC